MKTPNLPQTTRAALLLILAACGVVHLAPLRAEPLKAEPASPAQGRVVVSDPELLYSGAQIGWWYDGSFGTVRRDERTFQFWTTEGHGEALGRKVHYKYEGTLDEPLKKLVWAKPSHRSLIDFNGYPWQNSHIFLQSIVKVSDRELINFSHIERSEDWPNSSFSIGVLYSGDAGESWILCGDVIRPQANPANEKTQNNIGGVPVLVVGDYYYVYFNENGLGNIAVARAPVKQVIAAARSRVMNHGGAFPVRFKKHNGGAWSEDGLSGLASKLMPDHNDSHCDAHYNRALGRYVITLNEAGKLKLKTSADGIHWDDCETVIDPEPGPGAAPDLSWHCGLGGTDDCLELGSEFYVYWARHTWKEFAPMWRAKVTILPEPAGGAERAAARAEDWQSLAAEWRCPEWIQNAKFGLWLHWGPQSVPEYGGGWYARHMYLEPQELGSEQWGKNAWEYHRRTYGHQSEVGYKEICREWKAEKFDADSTLRRFKRWGARYAAIMANHHDNFDLFDSSVHLWNATRVGPKRDILGEFAQAARRHKLPWAATVHASRAPSFFDSAFGSDSQGDRKGVPYDGALQRQDGHGKWWEGLDPQQLYATRFPDFDRQFLQRVTDLVQNYQPDMLYYDDGKIPRGTGPAAELYARSKARHGSIQAIVTVKTTEPGTMHDIEKGGADKLESEPWQTDTTLANDWFLKQDEGDKTLRHDLRSLVENLVDIVSKNGSLLLNVAVRGDGSVPQDQREVLDAFGDWLRRHGEAVYGTRPWKVYGTGGAIRGGHFNERLRDSQPWSEGVLRFTRSPQNDRLFVFLFGVSDAREVIIEPLARKAGLFDAQIRKVSLVGTGSRLKWSLDDAGLRVSLPGIRRAPHCAVVAIETEGF